MASSVPKQYLRLGGRLLLDHGIARLVNHPEISGVCIALSNRDEHWTDSEFSGHPAVHRVTGGAERAHSVRNMLLSLKEHASPEDWVLVHDAARPCLRRKDLDQLIARCKKHPVGGLLATPVHDTMKRADDHQQVAETIPREGLWHAQTPQMFRIQPLLEAIEASLEAGRPPTDEAGAMERVGQSPLLVIGHSDNIKITRPGDLELAEFLLSKHDGQRG
jgi:2-C-methyl-D-erythritol 4-phosphate cytidylyltransferase